MGDLAVDSHVASAIEERNCIEARGTIQNYSSIERVLPIWKSAG